MALLLLLLALVAASSAFVGVPRARGRGVCVRGAEADPASSDSAAGAAFERYSNPSYARADVDRWWNELGDSLVTVGDKGVQSSHANSLLEYLYSHERVRVKLASDRVDSRDASEKLLANAELAALAEVLDIRKRGIMLGRRPGAKNAKIAVSKMESHGLCVDHFSLGHECRFGNKCRYSHQATGAERALLLQHLASMKPKRALNEALFK